MLFLLLFFLVTDFFFFFFIKFSVFFCLITRLASAPGGNLGRGMIRKSLAVDYTFVVLFM